MCVHLTTYFKIYEAKLAELEGKIETSTVTVRDLNISFSN